MNNEFYHAGPSSGSSRKDHKYLSREWKNGRWNYQYDQPKSKVSGGKSKDAAAAAVRFIAKDAADKYKTKIGRKATNRIKKAGSAINTVGIGKNAVDAAKKASSAYNAKNQPKVSKEYLEELGYNSQKNSFGNNSNTKKTDVEAKPAEKKRSLLDKLFDKLSNGWERTKDKAEDIAFDVSFEVEYAYDQAKNWVENGLENLERNTVGRVRDSLGYDERARMNDAKRRVDTEKYALDDSMGDVAEDLRRRELDSNDVDAHEDLRTSQYWLSKNNESYVKALRAYERAKEQYEKTPLAKIETWLDEVDEYWRKKRNT